VGGTLYRRRKANEVREKEKDKRERQSHIDPLLGRGQGWVDNSREKGKGAIRIFN